MALRGCSPRRAIRSFLAELARNGHDDDASRIICATAAKLHAPRDKLLPDLIPLDQWFRELEPAANRQGGILSLAAATARELLAAPQDVGVLHCDIRHGNILDFAERGWLAIDPKRLIGERGFVRLRYIGFSWLWSCAWGGTCTQPSGHSWTCG